jgi:thymidylate kinase
VQALLLSLFQGLDQQNIQYCLLRDQDQLDKLVSGAEIDLLVQASQLAQMQRLLAQLGFLRLPSWGHAPHHFFVGYDQSSDSWFKLDVMTEVAYGRPIAALRTELTAHCLDNRCRVGITYVPTPECELVMLLLHCVLDKRTITPARGRRLQTLRHQVNDEQYLSRLLSDYWLPTMNWSQLAVLIDAEDWPTLVAANKPVTARLEQRDRIGTRIRTVRERTLRKLSHYFSSGRSPSLTVALLAPDGAGKSTLAANLQSSFYFPVRSIYMGLYQKGRKDAGLPGVAFIQRLVGQWGRYLTARYYQQRGYLVIFDRYAYDAWLPARQPLNWLKQGRRWLLAHSCPPPDLVVLLDAPGELLHDRKGEHSVEHLEQQRQSYLQLRPHLPQMAVIDARQDADEVRREVIALIWRTFLCRQTGSQGEPVVGIPPAYVEGSMKS